MHSTCLYAEIYSWAQQWCYGYRAAVLDSLLSRQLWRQQQLRCNINAWRSDAQFGDVVCWFRLGKLPQNGFCLRRELVANIRTQLRPLWGDIIPCQQNKQAVIHHLMDFINTFLNCKGGCTELKRIFQMETSSSSSAIDNYFVTS